MRIAVKIHSFKTMKKTLELHSVFYLHIVRIYIPWSGLRNVRMRKCGGINNAKNFLHAVMGCLESLSSPGSKILHQLKKRIANRLHFYSFVSPHSSIEAGIFRSILLRTFLKLVSDSRFVHKMKGLFIFLFA